MRKQTHVLGVPFDAVTMEEAVAKAVCCLALMVVLISRLYTEEPKNVAMVTVDTRISARWDNSSLVDSRMSLR